MIKLTICCRNSKVKLRRIGDPLFGTFEAAVAAGFRLTGLTEEAGMRAVSGAATADTNSHGSGPVDDHGPVAELVVILLEEAFPAVIVLEQELCGSRYVHDAEYKMRLSAV
jgi:hypothetical protein